MHDVCTMCVTTMANVSAHRSYLKRMYVTHYYRVNKPLEIRERKSVIVMAGREIINYIIINHFRHQRVVVKIDDDKSKIRQLYDD